MSTLAGFVRGLDTQNPMPKDDVEKCADPNNRPSLLARLPTWLTRWIGYRAALPPPEPTYVTYIWSFTGAFCGLALIQAVFGYANYFKRRDVPPIMPSFVRRRVA